MKRTLRTVLAVVVLALLVWWGLQVLDLRSLWSALRGASIGPVVLAMWAAGAICLPAAARRGWYLVSAVPSETPMSYLQYFSLHAATSAVNAWFASPAGEVLRTLHLTRRGGYSLVASASAQIADRLQALALALVYRAAHLLPITLIGMASLYRIKAR